MLGPTGVGKTTLLTVMRKQMNSAVDVSQLKLDTGHPQIPGSAFETDQLLQKCLEDLDQLVKSKGYYAQGGIGGTGEPKKFYFNLSKLKKNASSAKLVLEFQDYPGGWIEKNASQVLDYIKDSSVTILVIDTPPLIHKKGKYHVSANKSEIVQQILLRAYSEDNSNKRRLLIFAPVKCEKYLQKANEYRQIEQSIRSGYKDLIESLNSEEFSNVSAVITPVQTVGNVLFSYVEEIEENGKTIPKFWYEKTNKHELAPYDAEQPLRYILGFALKDALDAKRTQRIELVNWFRDMLGLDDDLKTALQKFGEGCKKDGGFVVIKGGHLLG
ncbi:hypothetical protein [Calothrix sp. NIES-2100]|uniref:hypothetical protein n=1 Tax=Calothrix sp. NIES-2100 TaxID=1954172 RepID=UPI0030DC4443